MRVGELHFAERADLHVQEGYPFLSNVNSSRIPNTDYRNLI